MRKIKEIIVHCSATAEGKDFGAKDIDLWHKAQGWDCIGYHYVVKLDGTVESGRPIEKVGAHCKGHNSHSIGVCYVGGLASDGRTPKDTRTVEQKDALRRLLTELHRRHPKALIVGHADLDRRKPCCPGFDVIKEYHSIQPNS